jgi:hypothetical protein
VTGQTESVPHQAGRPDEPEVSGDWWRRPTWLQEEPKPAPRPSLLGQVLAWLIAYNTY